MIADLRASPSVAATPAAQQAAAARDVAALQPVRQALRSDRVVISDAGRSALAAEIDRLEADRSTAALEQDLAERSRSALADAEAPVEEVPRSVDAPVTEDDTTEDGSLTTEKPGEKAADEDGDHRVNGRDLTDAEFRQVQDLKTRDREVRTHEQAHLAAAGGYARGGASYTFQRGPDGRQYAVGGEVSIDTGSEKDPAATIQKMRIVRRAALAPAEPSGQDRAIAAKATLELNKALQELQQQRQTERSGETDERGTDSNEESAAATGEDTDTVTSEAATPPAAVDRQAQPRLQDALTRLVLGIA